MIAAQLLACIVLQSCVHIENDGGSHVKNKKREREREDETLFKNSDVGEL